MKNILFLLNVALIFSESCDTGDKKTVVSGTVTNKWTGEPIEKAYVELYIADGTHEHDFYVHPFTYTGPDGKYELTAYPPHYIDRGSLLASAPDYFGRFGTSVDLGESLVCDIQLWPKDATLRLHLKNLADTVLTTFYKLKCGYITDTPESYCVVDSFPVKIPPQSEVVRHLKIRGEATTLIFWSNQYFDRDKALFVDSVFCMRHDTVDFLIAF